MSGGCYATRLPIQSEIRTWDFGSLPLLNVQIYRGDYELTEIYWNHKTFVGGLMIYQFY